MKTFTFALCVLSLTSAHAQSNDSVPFKKHEIGVGAEMRYARLSPNIQYFYNVKPTQQFGIGLSGVFINPASNDFFFSPELSASYRWKKELFGGLSVYVAPTISYSFMYSNSEPTTYKYGLGVQTGLEYDFSKKRLPIVVGAGFKTMATYGSGRFGYSVSPTVSVRFKF